MYVDHLDKGYITNLYIPALVGNSIIDPTFQIFLSLLQHPTCPVSAFNHCCRMNHILHTDLITLPRVPVDHLTLKEGVLQEQPLFLQVDVCVCIFTRLLPFSFTPHALQLLHHICHFFFFFSNPFSTHYSYLQLTLFFSLTQSSLHTYERHSKTSSSTISAIHVSQLHNYKYIHICRPMNISLSLPIQLPTLSQIVSILMPLYPPNHKRHQVHQEYTPFLFTCSTFPSTLHHTAPPFIPSTTSHSLLLLHFAILHPLVLVSCIPIMS